jgi:hypothetical protein
MSGQEWALEDIPAHTDMAERNCLAKPGVGVEKLFFLKTAKTRLRQDDL